MIRCKLIYKRCLLLSLAMVAVFSAVAQDSVQAKEEENKPFGDFFVSLFGNASTGDFAPYMIGSWNHGKNVQKNAMLIDALLRRGLDTDKRLCWGAGLEVLTGYSSTAEYERWRESAQEWTHNSIGPAGVWVQQIYGEMKYRSVFLTVGMKEHESALLNFALSSGDLVESGNARPIPEARIGFIDFQDIPFTNGWVQIQGEISYGKMIDGNFLKRHFNYYTSHLNFDPIYSYKRCYFRTKPSKPLSVTVGMQVGAFFGGHTEWYRYGKLVEERKFSESFSSFLKMFLPIGENGEDNYVGQSLGSWDFHARYRLRSGREICAYFQWPWEDGSSIAKRNRLDGLWGLEYRSGKPGLITGVVLEYIDFRDQCGPVHWQPSDTPGTSVTSVIGGKDDYYNNYYYNAYANYGMAIGTPFLMSPIYNLDGNPGFACNRANGFHFGVMGNATSTVDYRLLVSYQRGLGTYTSPYHKPRTCFSMMAEAKWDASRWLKGLDFKAQLAFDSGDLRGNNFGFSLAVAYRGLLR